MPHPYRYLIERYFPASAQDDAECIAGRECDPMRAGYPQSCVADEGVISCNPNTLPYLQSYSYGPMQILDACWSPYRNPASPFTPEQWGMVLDPNVNIWMASVIWSRRGFAAWTTCGACGVCDVPGGAIPYPDGPVLPFPPSPLPGGVGLTMVLGIGLVLTGALMSGQRSTLVIAKGRRA